MEIVRLEETAPKWHRAWELYTEAADEMLYAAMTPETFRNRLSGSGDDIFTVSLLDREGTAFASGCLEKKSGKRFVTMVIVQKRMRRQGRGREILSALEHILEAEGAHGEEKTVFELSFFNPVALIWELPGKKKVTHPNAPGVDVGSGAYLFFKNCGYREFALQNSYYLDLGSFVYPDVFRKKQKRLEEEGITFQVYDRRIHRGMEKLLQESGNPLWEKEILEEPGVEEGGGPVLVPVRDGRVLGFTGPLRIEKSGRGYFAGIAVAEDVRGKGLGKILFYELCKGLREKGAAYMTLFTGENNPARNIYEEAGFRIVRSWSDMRRTT